jgi:hypothetical protein
VTRYAIDRARNALIAQWSTGIGDTATTVTELPRALVPGRDLLRLTTCLTELSQACWRCYTHPASAAEHHGPGSLGWHRQRERDAFTAVPPLLTTAKRPADEATTNVERAAHAIGRTLDALDAAQLTAQVTTDVAAELTAVEQAELGNLTGRAEQAVALSREDASPLQVSQADTLLHRHPFGADDLRTQIDPTAAAIAAANWLFAAVTVAARLTGLHPGRVVAATDQQAKPLAVESLADIVVPMTGGSRPRHVVMPLIRNALHVAEGHVRGITDARHRITAAERLIERAHGTHPELDLSPDAIRLPLTSLNPARPALDLLENLLHGIHSCWELYEQHTSPQSGGPVGVRQEEALDTFLTEVRREAAARSEHLF